MYLFRIRFLTLFLIALSVQSFGQQFTIKGKVFNSENKEGLPFVPVIIKGTTIGTQTDFDGNFTIKTTKLGDSLIASYVGFKRTSRKINKTLAIQEINMPMANEGLSLDEVAIQKAARIEFPNIHSLLITYLYQMKISLN